MKRLFYIAIGVGVGVAAVRQVSKAAQRMTPSGVAGSLSESIAGLGESLRGFIDDVRLAMAEREIELTDALTGETSGGAGHHVRGHLTSGNGRSAS